MRLTQIKLAGFKSFADPTVIPTPGELVGIVGPNGCGKSNIIDAVRWVLGESRATELRGATMQDVIFNGSGRRKAAARASVELFFDNSAGRAGGPWAGFTEIVVRRVLTRDGTSSYFINQQAVRRRDVHDIFLGTGLGTRGYAIIGQGMINRLIEARPEDLRVMLEEAAGVSRYKERRRETENRLRDTRENLVRLEDVQHELEARLSHLHRQAEQARHYRSLQAERDFKQQALWLVREQAAQAARRALALELEQAEGRLQAASSRHQSLEAALEALRVRARQTGDALQQAQGQLLDAGARVSRLEAEIRHVAQTEARLRARHDQLRAQQREWDAQRDRAQASLEALQGEIDVALVQATQRARAVQAARESLPRHEAQWRGLTQQQDRARQAIAATQQELALLAQRQRDLADRRKALDARAAQQRAALQALTPWDEAALQRRADEAARRAHELSQARDGLAQLEARHDAAVRARDEAQRLARACRDALQAQRARHDALRALQAQVQGQGQLQPWLQHNGWADGIPLWRRIEVDAGWETALEAVLGQRLGALEAVPIESLATAAAAPPSRISFYGLATDEAAAAEQLAGRMPAAPGARLLDRVRVADAGLRAVLEDWLGSVYLAPDLHTALAQRRQLPRAAQWVVAEGHCVDSHGVHFYAPDQEGAGLLERRRQIADLAAEIERLAREAERAQAALAQAEQAVGVQADAQRQGRKRWMDCQEASHRADIDHREGQQAHQRNEERRQHLIQAVREAEAQGAALAQRLDQASARATDFARHLAEQQATAAQIAQQLAVEQAQLDQERDQLRACEHAAQEADYAVRTLRHRKDELQRSLQMAHDQLGRSNTELDAVQGELFTLDASQAEAQLQQALAARTACEAALRAAREAQDAAADELRHQDEDRMRLQRELDPLRAQLGELRLSEQAERLTAEQFTAELDAHQIDRAALSRRLQEEAPDRQQPSWLQAEVQRLARRMEAMGAVNLAALEELQAAGDRQTYLAAQRADLLTAVGTLEDAIRRIDRETRERLAQTFEAVNGHFAVLFPRLFGGGQARLLMTGDEILDAGVQVLAQPPGKRNSSIQLLSGGEKALTATALVFALFTLNPAPFCLLDEVDAPLDDANTDRLVALVRSMSEQTQFLFISHNKIAMQMARQLVGVTMQEQGVSRIVAVDMDAALQLAAQAA